MKTVRNLLLTIFCTTVFVLVLARLANLNLLTTSHELMMAIFPPAPCSVPIRYNIGTVDKRFGISQSNFIKKIESAALVWDNAVAHNLFVYATTSPDLTINLIFDYRQQATTDLKKIGATISSNRATYDSLKERYDRLHEQYLSLKRKLDAEIIAYDTHTKTYEEAVKYWNERGGAPENTYKELANQRDSLNNEAREINSDEMRLNDLVSAQNTIVPSLNQIAKNLNLNVSSYNNIGLKAGEEFSEGEYVSDISGNRINIYQYSDETKLIRVLEHELGHALGLAHNNNPQSIMYSLNQGHSNDLTVEDLADLQKLCEGK